MNVVHQSRYITIFMVAAFVIALSIPAFAGVNPASVAGLNKSAMLSIAHRYSQGLPISPTEKQQLLEYASVNPGAFPHPVTPPRIFELDTTGGPDSSGYRFIDSNSPGGPTYNWVDITSDADGSVLASTDDGSAAINMGTFSFPFYGQNYTGTSASVCSNGWLTFGGSSGIGYYNSNLPAQSGTAYNQIVLPAICTMWDDWVQFSGGVKYKNMGDGRFVVDWNGYHFSTASDSMEAEAILYSSGDILFQYRRLIGGSTMINSTIGLQGASTGGQWLQYMDSTFTATDGLAILFYHLGSASNPVPANNSTNVPTNTSLSWTAGSAAAAYNVFFGTDNPPTTQVITHQNVLTYSPTLANSTSYYWKVVSLSDTSGTGNTAEGPVWHFSTGTGTAPQAPTNGGVASNPAPTNSSISITWTDNSTDETGFPIYVMADGDPSFTLAGTASANATSYTVTGLNSGSHYTFHIYASNAAATSLNYATAAGWTNPVTAGALTLALAGGGFNSIQVASIGTDGNSSNTVYEVMDTDNELYIQANNTLGNTPRISSRSGWNGIAVNGLTSGATYHFQAIAMNGATPPVTASGPISSITTNDMSHGGPDGYGYRYITSDAVGGPTFNWETVTGTTPAISSGSTDDGYYGPLDLGFTFNFYGTDYTQFYIGTNGYVNFGSGTNSIPGAGTFPLNGWPAGIYYWARDAATTYASAVKYQTLTNPNRLVIEVDGWAPVYSSSANQLDWQMIIFEDGRMIIQYRNYVGAVSTYWGTIGLQTASGTLYNFPFCTSAAQCPTANTAVMFYRLGIPSQPIPADAATAVPTNTSLEWTSAIAAVNYNVYFGTANPPTTLVSTHQLGTFYTPTLAASTTYYWKVVAFGDTAGTMSNAGPVWSFTTGTGAAPVSPTNGAISTDPGPTLHSLTVTWTDGADNETGFPITRSTDGTTFTALTTVPGYEGTGTVAYTDTGLTINTHYWYRIYAANAAATTTNFATVDGWTLADVPPAPTLGASGITYATITLSAGNDPAVTQFAIYDSTFNNYLQANGTLATNAVWQTLAQWGITTAMSNLSSGTNYIIKVKARNGANVETGFSPSLTVATSAAMVLPFIESFAASTPWPPYDWQNVYPTGASYYWQYSTNANGGTTGAAYFNMYYASARETAILWTPPISTTGVTSAHVSFDWWFSGYLTGTDTFQVVYSTDGGTTYNVFWERYSGGTGGTEGSDIHTNISTTNYYQFPSTTATEWASTEAVIPAGALGQTSVTFGFKAVSGASMYTGSSLGLDNVQIFSVTVPRIGFNMTNVSYGYRVTNGTYLRGVYVKNTGADTLRITNVTATTLTPSWTTQSIIAGDSALLNLSWHPTTAGPMADTIHFTSNANNSGTVRLTASGMGVDIATLPCSQGFTSNNPWPPSGWQNVYPIGASYYWQYSSNGNGGAGAAYDNLYYTTPRQVSVFWSPPINTVGSAAVRIDFDWWYSGYLTSVDTLQLVYSIDGGITFTSFWERYGNGTGGPAGTDLRTNTSTTNYYQIPSSTASEWASTTVMVPDSALNVNGVSFGWRTVKGPTQYTGSSLGLDNILINVAGITTVGGTVLRADQTGIDSALVTLVNTRRMTTSLYTNVNGHWTTSVLADTYNISIYKPCVYPNYEHQNVVLAIDSTTRFDGDTVYMPQVEASPTSLEFIVQPGGTASQTIVLTDPGDWPTDFQASIQYPTSFDKARHAPKHSMLLSPVVNTDAVLTSTKLSGKKPLSVQLVPSKNPVRQTESTDELNSTVIIGTGTSNQSFPFYNFWWYTRSAMIYTAAELGRAGTIDSIGWYATAAGIWNETTEHAYIYLMHTPLTTFTATTYSTFSATATLVKTIDHYTGPSVLNDWDMLALDTPFIYNGTDNLMVIVQIDQSGYPTTSQYNTYTATTGSTFQYWYQDSTPPTGTGYVTTYRPNIRMDLITFDYCAVSPEQGQIIQGQPFELSITATVPDTTPINTDLSATVFVTTNACTTLTIPVMIHVLENSVQQASNLPREYKLHQNYPNPFNPTTEIRFDLKAGGMTKLTVYNSLGQVVAKLVDAYLPAGYHSVRFRNERAATGVYFYRLESGKFTAMKKMVLVK